MGRSLNEKWWACSLLMAAEACKVDGVDVLVSDVGLPNMDGYCLLQQVRQFALEQVLPATALTAYAGEINRQTALASGYQQYLSKQIEPEALISAVTELIGQGKS